MKKLLIIILLVFSLCVLGLAGGLALITPPPVEAQTHTMINIIAVIRMGLEEEP